jgi:hypothetical protein
MTCTVKRALREANEPNVNLYTHEEDLQAMQTSRLRVRQPC